MLFDSLIKPALESVTALVAQFHLSPEDKVKAQEQIEQIAAQAKQAAFDQDVKLNDIAGQNIRDDKSSARPAFLYIIEAILAFNYIGLKVAQLWGSKVEPISLPPDLLALFGVCITGYVFSRTGAQVCSMPGDSVVSMLGVKIANKS